MHRCWRYQLAAAGRRSPTAGAGSFSPALALTLTNGLLFWSGADTGSFDLGLPNTEMGKVRSGPLFAGGSLFA